MYAIRSYYGDLLSIGRDSSNEIAVNDAEVSRRHARLTFQGGKYVLDVITSYSIHYTKLYD